MKFPWWWSLACVGVQIVMLGWQLWSIRRYRRRQRAVMRLVDTLCDTVTLLNKCERVLELHPNATTRLLLTELRTERLRLCGLMVRALSDAPTTTAIPHTSANP